MLLDYFGRDFHNEYMDELGCETLKTNGMWAPKATTEDFVVLWNELYDYFREGTEYSEVYRKACTNSDFTYLDEGMTDWDYSINSFETISHYEIDYFSSSQDIYITFVCDYFIIIFF